MFHALCKSFNLLNLKCLECPPNFQIKVKFGFPSFFIQFQSYSVRAAHHCASSDGEHGWHALMASCQHKDITPEPSPPPAYQITCQVSPLIVFDHTLLWGLASVTLDHNEKWPWAHWEECSSPSAELVTGWGGGATRPCRCPQVPKGGYVFWSPQTLQGPF